MVVAMAVAMMVLEPLRGALMPDGRVPAVVAGPEALSLVMATEMSAGMWVWMRLRGQPLRETLQMCAAMYASLVVLFPFLWVGLVSGETLLIVGHLIMLATMWVLVSRHRSRYAGRSQASVEPSKAAPAAPASDLDDTRGEG
jgi:flagellar biosynthetic protein FliP